MKLKEVYKAAIRKNKSLKLELAFKLDISSQTLHRWIRTDDRSITILESLNIIAKHLNISNIEELCE